MMIIRFHQTHSTRALLRAFHTTPKFLNAAPTEPSVAAPSPASTSPYPNMAVVGLGLMGHGIAQIAATSGIHSTVVAYENNEASLTNGRNRIETSVGKLVQKGRMTEEDADAALSKIKYTTHGDDLSAVDLVVEAVVEDIAVKKQLYGEFLSRICKPGCVFASNTSSLSITEMALLSDRPQHFVGLHFFNPVQIMKLVEVIQTDHTDARVFEDMVTWVKGVEKVAVTCGDTPGFIVNRLLVPGLMQAMSMVDRKDASVKDIDLSLQLGAGHPMGPLHLSDYIGLDTVHSITKGWMDKYPDEPAFVMPNCLQEKVNNGDFGRKTGKGFYHWKGDRRGDPV